MKKLTYIALLAFAVLALNACNKSTSDYDASGSFEAIERTISAEATGKIMYLNLEEGQLLKANDTIGRIDISNLELQSQQVSSVIESLGQNSNGGNKTSVLSAQLQTQQSQIALIEQQLANLNKEVARFQNLVSSHAVPQKQLDDLLSQKAVLQKQLNAAKTQTALIKAQIGAQVQPSKEQLKLINKQMSDGTIINNYNGTVTTKLAYDGEFTSVGRPLYKIADLSNITLRAYISGNQLPIIKLNQEVIVSTDDGKGGFKETQGVITWISSKAEFTPKTIQTKDERANLVYAIKVTVPNNGEYKIGMYGEIKF